jgi:hypothetical protein
MSEFKIRIFCRDADFYLLSYVTRLSLGTDTNWQLLRPWAQQEMRDATEYVLTRPYNYYKEPMETAMR